ncbi:hypothetical protein A3G67_03500 [Candidatus Roizmanbacteria bacterium RIFCSPLOWO2_12_FULL_40_12]|uniref:Uncharacterized protein n=1 Tax=Candidatus Roizmanbacteria bacterium RIFCSPLOWO2_01_FULL_40_42 TaxID=1802066 RepID=A0A1F7J5K4_9BACT|nr:MAG: hypothetical protein A2779_03135 [Candidatus Roizmanbacteria bacterium RIFCSPHIGHO2_01_FULL_40_98]OGK28334.1 MAG: hypothetical protein A3C31_00500 [Candidatus Roizmanbacteria bacterium RIFCSPHIGHO2_02_FULL_40_53]OGK30570.1 MAG: hypothetical protein A2W49_03185 [Candidatus Roizmanbacteria bacterium RIFCSPHIGHO2_12_41_18]OGK36984.1 MAG: hypothetical protein A3E69_00760 [Candidatus Roizmanbacteria bacterium RIFCSPHIGHO2_12_FULL_40_130]OGK50890.1 MAG: hypothetical protein A3B50_01270 [Candi
MGLKDIDNKWFFTELSPLFKIPGFFVKGDLIILLPLLIAILLIGFISLKFMFVTLGVYITIRHLGEMIYWFSHQFNARTYRPDDMGFKKLDNHAIYILYQTLAIVGTIVGLSIVAYSLLYLK